MSESKVVPDGVDYNTAIAAIANHLTEKYFYAYEVENNSAETLKGAVKVFNAVRIALSTGKDLPADLFTK